MIIEEPNIVDRINSHLSPQIRVWGYERTKSSFNAYQLCDSRIYEYLIPTHCFLPPHPKSFLGRKLVELADEAGDREGYGERQSEVADFWEDAHQKYILPALESFDSDLRTQALEALHESLQDRPATELPQDTSSEQENVEPSIASATDTIQLSKESDQTRGTEKASNEQLPDSSDLNTEEAGSDVAPHVALDTAETSKITTRPLTPLEGAVKVLKNALLTAKLASRIHPARLERIHSILTRFIGTHSFHNYTVRQSFKDASSKRIIKSFVAAPPTVIHGIEWLSLKIHGQSFMMHQIRKTVALVALAVRTGCPEARIADTLGSRRYTIPKAPGLGLLLERPVFDSYNVAVARLAARSSRAPTAADAADNVAAPTPPPAPPAEPIDFARFADAIEAFKQSEIYDRIRREEAETNAFHGFFSALDNRPGSDLLWLSSMGMQAVERGLGGGKEREVEDEDDEDEVEGEEGG